MPYTQADLDALDAEIKQVQSVQSTTFADQSVTFRSLDELMRLRAIMAQSVAVAAGASRTRYASTSKGV